MGCGFTIVTIQPIASILAPAIDISWVGAPFFSPIAALVLAGGLLLGLGGLCGLPDRRPDYPLHGRDEHRLAIASQPDRTDVSCAPVTRLGAVAQSPIWS